MAPIKRATFRDTWGSEALPLDVAEEPDFTQLESEGTAPADTAADADSVRLYFRQIGHVPLLKARDERLLCQRIESTQKALAAALLAFGMAHQSFPLDQGLEGRKPVLVIGFAGVGGDSGAER